MRNSSKNKPGKIFIISMVVLIIMIISYLVMVSLFPSLFSSLNGTNAVPQK